ncbi:MAG: TetR/AcrR family transcriptional regulator [Dehalobacterium sp.]
MPKETFFRLRDDKQERILRAAIHEFVENGFDRAKIGDIAQNANVATGSIYQYFKDKKELFVYCAEWGLQVLYKKLNERMNIGDMDIFEYLQEYMANVEVMDKDRELILFMQLMAKEPGLKDDSMKAMYNVGGAYGKKLLQNSKRRGKVRTDIDDDLLMEYFTAVAERFGLRWMNRYWDFVTEMTEEQSRTIQKELTQMLELLKKGMGC